MLNVLKGYVIPNWFQPFRVATFLVEKHSKSDFDSQKASEIDLERCVLILILILILIEGG